MARSIQFLYFISIFLLSQLICIDSFHINSFQIIKRTRLFESTASPNPTTESNDPIVKSGPITLKEKLTADMKDAMRAKDKQKLAAVRAIQTAIKQKEVDERVEVTDEMIVLIMSKLIKQRKESIKSYAEGGRKDLVDAEQMECNLIESYMPAQLSLEEVEKEVDAAVAKLGATSVKDMGKVMAEIKQKLAGKADLSEIGAIVKRKLQ